MPITQISQKQLSFAFGLFAFIPNQKNDSLQRYHQHQPRIRTRVAALDANPTRARGDGYWFARGQQNFAATDRTRQRRRDLFFPIFLPDNGRLFGLSAIALVRTARQGSRPLQWAVCFVQNVVGGGLRTPVCTAGLTGFLKEAPVCTAGLTGFLKEAPVCTAGLTDSHLPKHHSQLLAALPSWPKTREIF